MTDTYKGDNLEIVEKALYCNEHGDTESCENWLTMLRDRIASAAPAEVVTLPVKLVQLLGLVRKDGVLKRSSELQEAFRLLDSAIGEKHAD